MFYEIAIVSLQVLKITLTWKLYKTACKILTKVKTEENPSDIFDYKGNWIVEKRD